MLALAAVVWHEAPMNLLARRAVLQGGLAGLATLLSRSLVSCSSKSSSGEATNTTADTGPDGNEFAFTPIARPRLVSSIAAIGALGEPDANGVRLPPGFTARIVAKSGAAPVSGKPYVWHSAPDGGATFPTADGGWIYVSNSEVPFAGGVGALRFDAAGNPVDAYRILDGTNVNCAGGPTPWDTWLSCEEIYKGRVHECDPRGELPAVARPALGVFKHEAAAVDPIRHHVYLTEDENDGCFYRFVPDGLAKHGFANLSAGKLEVAEVKADGSVTWHLLPDPTFELAVPTRLQIAQATHFDGGEGIWWHAGVVYFTSKGDNHVRAYDTNASSMTALYAGDSLAEPVLSGVDNVTVSASGDVLVAEDGGDMQIVAILPSGELKPLMQLVGYPDSEITGPAFDPSGTRLYFSSQRGANGGTTFEITGPFHAPA
jgi:secreted PhoX family phosphatase